jgi:uncharacterized OB-fold protein
MVPRNANVREFDTQVAGSVCGHCGTKYAPKRHWQRFCSSVCRFADWDEKNPRQRTVTEKLERIESKIDLLLK